MGRALRLLRRLVVLSIVVAGIAFGWKTRTEAQRLVTSPRDVRKVASATPAARQLPFEDAQVTTDDGLRLHGWFIPSPGDAVVMLVHGYKDHRGATLGIAEILHRHGYDVLVASLRAHDVNDGELISFGLHETADLDAWYQYLRQRTDLSPGRIGLFGVSMGGTIGIRYASQNLAIRALVADCAFSSAADTVETSVKFFTGLPAFPFAPAIVFWMEREIGGRASDLDATTWIRQIAPRAVLLLQGGADRVVSPESGARLFAAAGEPKDLWFEAAVGHAQFLRQMPAQFEERVTGFLNRYLRQEP